MSGLRVLDVGCADGAFAHLLHRELGRGVERVDGIDADAVIVERARARGLPGQFHAGTTADLGGLADAELLYDAYDVVYSFEVIEHVPDIDTYLTELEAMVKPGGLIYLSTPNGCFGAGGNKHHLRAIRPVDLADRLRRRGEIDNMVVGDDGITNVAYRPGPRTGREWAIVAPSPTRWAPGDMEHAGLGGSETAACRVAEQLAGAGEVVTIHGALDSGAWTGGIVTRDLAAYDPLSPVDVLMVSRAADVLSRPSRARTRVLWVHDVDCGDQLTPEVAQAADAVLCLSQWHEQHLRHRYPFLGGKLRRVSNGIHPPYFNVPELPKLRRVVYSSSPDRGLDVLLDLWPKVLEQVPDALLTYAYSPVYWQVAEVDPTLREFAAKVKELSDQPGVTCETSLSQPALAMLMHESRVWAHPSYSTVTGGPFHETSCIGAMEAQAAGCHVVASNWGALNETVRHGALIDGPPLTDQWRTAFVAEIVRGLTDEATIDAAQRHALDAREVFAWEHAAQAILTAVG